MKFLRRGALALLFVMTLLTSLLVSPSVAGASSIYDNVFATATSAKVSDTYDVHTCAAQDIASSWAGYLMDDSKWNQAVYGSGTDRETVQSAFLTALSNGSGWSVVERQFMGLGMSIGNFVWGSGDYGVQVIFTPDPNNETTFLTYRGWDYAALKGEGSSPVYVVVLGQYWNGSPGSCSIGVAVSRMVTSDATDYNFVDKEAYVGHNNLDLNSIYRQLFVGSSIVYPAGYAGELIPTSLPPAKTVAMGDSYSSGEGNPPFEYGTDVSNVNGCHRSPLAYPRLLQSNQNLHLEPVAFMACSGATTANIIGGQWNEPPQTSALTDETEVVTLTVGGNDVGFSDYVRGCFVACGPETSIYDAMMNSISQPAFKANLVSTYEAILTAAPNADLYVGDYPYLTDESTTTCQGLDVSGAREVQEALNDVIHSAVFEVGLNSNRIFNVETNYISSPFEGGYLCGGGQSLFNGLVAPPNDEYSLHPNTGGQAAYAAVFAGAIG